MIIAVASGKGGTVKITVATSLALTLALDGPVHFLDCDVEAPNAHLFLQAEFQQNRAATLPVPVIDARQCNQCGICADVCQYQALAVAGTQVLVFPELCHGCGSCALNCPTGAIRETPRALGKLQRGITPDGIQFARGTLNIGEKSGVPVIRQLQDWAIPTPPGTVIIDAPPGTACPVVEAVHNADYVVLVTEPTPFGFHDLQLAYQLTCQLGIPAGVVINRDGMGDQQVDDFCAEVDLPVLLRIPMERTIAAGLAQGVPLITLRPEYHPLFTQLAQVVIGSGA